MWFARLNRSSGGGFRGCGVGGFRELTGTPAVDAFLWAKDLAFTTKNKPKAVNVSPLKTMSKDDKTTSQAAIAAQQDDEMDDW